MLVQEVLAAAQSAGFALADKIAVLARGEAAKICHDATEIEVLIFDSTGKLVGRGDG